MLKQRQDSLFQASVHIDRNILIHILPMILLNKCAFGCKIGLHVFQTLWKRPLPIILGTFTQFFLMPFCGFLLTQILSLPEAQAFRCVMTCTCPGGVGLSLCSASRKRYHFGYFDYVHASGLGPYNDTCQFLPVQ